MNKTRNFVLSALVPLAMSALIVACDDNPQKPASNDNVPGNSYGNENHGSNPQNGGTPSSSSETVVNTAEAGGITFDLVIRDFPVTHPDFENFSSEYASRGDYNYCELKGATSGLCGELILNAGLPGYDASWYALEAYHMTCGNVNSKTGAWIGQDGLPNVANLMLPTYLQRTTATDTLKYGECADKEESGRTRHGYVKVADAAVRGSKCTDILWSNPVYYTPGMVQPYLVFTPDPETGEIDMLDGVKILKAGELCDNQFFDEWYDDNNSFAKRTNTALVIPSDASNAYSIDYNYSNGGYFPLDVVDPVSLSFKSVATKENGGCTTDQCEQWGPQSLSITCPPYDYQYAPDQKDAMNASTDQLCAAWLLNGGPRSPDAAMAAAGAAPYNVGLHHLRNFGFTEMGYVKFKYRSANQVPSPEVFEIAGDDDIWVFVDGVLAIDLGGTHSPTPGNIDMFVLARNGHGCHAGEPLADYSNCDGVTDATGWADDTWHHLHFFHAKRQTGESNFLIRTNLGEVASSRYAP